MVRYFAQLLTYIQSCLVLMLLFSTLSAKVFLCQCAETLRSPPVMYCQQLSVVRAGSQRCFAEILLSKSPYKNAGDRCVCGMFLKHASCAIFMDRKQSLSAKGHLFFPTIWKWSVFYFYHSSFPLSPVLYFFPDMRMS